MKRFLFFGLFLAAFAGLSNAQEHPRYALIWHDEFDGPTLDSKVWMKIRRSTADWAKYMSYDERLFAFEDGDLVLRGMVNDFLPNDKAPFLTGGVWTKHKKAFGFGRLEIRAKFDVAEGYWPAIWMLPNVNKDLNWPHGGEIDIMEHFDISPMVDQTVHSSYTVNLGKRNRPPQVARPSYRVGEYNTYGMERFYDSLVFFVNGERTFNYPRYRKGVDGQFPFSQHDYYLIVDSQLGRKGGPEIDTTQLPVELRVDYVRYYEVDTRTDVIPEPKEFQQFCSKKKKLRKVVYDKKTHFDDPDEYRIVMKCGKATLSGNRQWAESTLTQLVDENGYIANLEVRDRAACPVRGISLDKYNKRLTFNDLIDILDAMAFYKLNYLQWNEGIFSEEEVNLLKERASDLGITMVAAIPLTRNVDVADLEDSSQLSAASVVFLQTASKDGGWFCLKSLEANDIDAMRAFAERYWRGGDAGEGTIENGLPDVLSTAGSRLANFKEKLTVHRERFQ